MRKFLASLTVFASLSLVLMIPAYAQNTNSTPYSNHPYTTLTDGGPVTGTNNGIGSTYGPNGMNGTTTGTNRLNGNNTTYGTTGTYGANRMYGTNGTYGAFDASRTRMNGNGTNMTNRTNNNVRALETTTRRNFDWGWLGLLGLFGLAGMRSKNRDEVR